MARKILVTSALPYANHHIHMGHLVEYLQTDMWVRFQRLRGHEARYICADDTHGTAIMMRAQSEGITEEALIAQASRDHQAHFAGFDIAFDHYGSTHSQSNRELCAEFWQALRKADAIAERDVSQLFDPKAGVFLADRFVSGSCPKCKSANQYGDNCEVCGSTYSPTELIDPVSTLTGSKPEVRTAKHLFVTLEKYHAFLDEWTQGGQHLQPQIANYLKGHFLAEPLRDWDVSRPAPYFGFEIPDSPGNYWYVWFDAPIGYLASTRDWCAKSGQRLDDWWKNPQVEIHHFIGKDITYFHTLFWPAMLKAAGYSLPTRVQVHGFLTVNGEKMSKRKGTFIMAQTYLEHLDPSYLRYYYASKLSSKVDDLDLDAEDFIAKVNGDLVGKVVNLCSRMARFVEGATLPGEYPEDGGLFAQGATAGESIAQDYEQCDYAGAMRTVMTLADRANEYVDRMQPWTLKKQADRQTQLVEVCTVALSLYRQIAVYLAPVLPRLAKLSGDFLGAPLDSWALASVPLTGAKLGKFQHLMERADMKKMQEVMAASAEPEAAGAKGEPLGHSTVASTPDAKGRDYGEAIISEPLAPECTIDDFTKVDLRVAEIVAAEAVPEAKKLLKLTVSFGGEIRRTVFAGIKAAYEPQALVGRLVIVVANLKPRTMKFGVSEGMVLAAGPGEKDVFLLAPDSGARPGQRVH